MSFNWRSGNLAVNILSNDGGVDHDFLTVQNIDFSFDDNIEVMDSLNKQRLGYFYAPRRIRITMGVLPSEYEDTPTPISDSDILYKLQAYLISGDYYSGMFSLTVTDDHSGHVYAFTDCIVMSGGPGNVIMDRRPVSQWTIMALDSDMTEVGTTNTVGYLKDGAKDLSNDVSIP